MKKSIILILFIAFAVNIFAQTTAKKKTATSAQKKTTAKTAPTEITVTLVSKCEKQVMIFAGAKQNLRQPKQKQIGGMSTNKLYLKTGDVVCIMNAQQKPESCIDISKTTTQLEINSAGTAVVAK